MPGEAVGEDLVGDGVLVPCGGGGGAVDGDLLLAAPLPAVEKAVSTPVETAVSDYVPWYKKIFS